MTEESLSSDEIVFLKTREATNRSGLAKYLKAENTDNEAVKQEATTRYRELPLLLDPSLHSFALGVLTGARHRRIDSSHRFQATLWFSATDTYDGRDFLGNFGDFVTLLSHRAKILAPKREGWVVEPTTNADGHRTNASTKAIHAVFLDCDGRGEWTSLLSTLEKLDFAFIAYQSGGWTPTIPKWRIIFPLVDAFDTSTEQKQDSWKQIYHHIRVIIGAVAQLRGEGFDPTTDTPCCPWFLTERRNEQDPQRAIVWRTGHALDLMSLVLALPPIEESELRTTSGPRIASDQGLADEKLEEIIAELSKATVFMPSKRHELYLALPGVLLDRGVPPDEVLTIIESVSLNYPRSHPELHADNMHGAQTTIAKWIDGGNVTRIGTLNERWPEVAKAVDKVLPSVTSLLAASTEKMLSGPSASGVLPQTTIASLPKKRRRKLSALGKEIVPIVASMKRSKNEKRRFAAKLVDRILDGETFQTEDSTTEQVDVLVCLAVEALGFDLPSRTWNEILDLASVTLLSMDFTQSVERVNKAALAFMKGQRKKREWIIKQNQKFETEQAKLQKYLDAAKGNL